MVVSAEFWRPAAVQVIPSRGLKVAGLLGPAAAVEKKSQNVADVAVGIGGTTQWKLAGLVRLLALVLVQASQNGDTIRSQNGGFSFLKM